jgi:hypothetical protein
MGQSTLAEDWIKQHKKPAPPENWMSFDEYLTLCGAAGLR